MIGLYGLGGVAVGAGLPLFLLLLQGIGFLPDADALIAAVEAEGGLQSLPPGMVDLFYGFIEVLLGVGGALRAVVFALALGLVGAALGAALSRNGAPPTGGAGG